MLVACLASFLARELAEDLDRLRVAQGGEMEDYGRGWDQLEVC